ALVRSELAQQAELVDGIVLLRTCHRVELYGWGNPPQLVTPIRLDGESAVNRIFRIAAGLESAVIWEDEVLHQVRQALAAARRQGTVDFRLGRLFESAISVGRQARASRRTAPSGLAVRAMEWVGRQIPIRERPLLVVGAGTVGRALALAAEQSQAIVRVATRTPREGELTLGAAAELAPKMAAILVALNGEWVDLARVGEALPPLADLSFPPAVPEAVRERLGEGYLEMDQLFHQLPSDALWMERAAALVSTGRDEYIRWLRSRQIIKEVAHG
ncbi:MAG: hypothetical protein ACREP9_14690, partial [Candidatus Dormibacteraceae bacterium]